MRGSSRSNYFFPPYGTGRTSRPIGKISWLDGPIRRSKMARLTPVWAFVESNPSDPLESTARSMKTGMNLSPDEPESALRGEIGPLFATVTYFFL